MKKVVWLIVIILFYLFITNLGQKPNNTKDIEEQMKIWEYEEKHRDDWKGYKGTRRGSSAENEKLIHDGYDPEEYRQRHGY